jgi:hypothetical protein
MAVTDDITAWVREFVAGWVNPRFFPRQVHQQTSRGSSGNGLPIVLNRDGKIDDSFIDGDLAIDSLNVTRDLAAASTSAPVVSIVQEHAGDDQAALVVRQDGTNDIFRLYDGANEVLSVDGGGRVLVTQLATTGVGFKVERNLASTSTDNNVVSILQSNVGDDQEALIVRNDGTGDILRLIDGGTNVFQVLDGGIVQIGTDALVNTLRLTLSGTDAVTSYAALARYSADTGGSGVNFYKSRNASIGSHTVVQSDDTLGSIFFRGSDGNSYEIAALIRAEVDGTPGNGDMPGRIVFQTTPDGSATPATAFTISSTKNATLVGTLTAAGINVGETDMTVYSESTWNPVLTGSSANPTSVTYTRYGNHATTNKRCHLQGGFTVDAITIGAAAGQARISLPTTAASGNIQVLSGYFFDSSTSTYYPCAYFIGSSSSFALVIISTGILAVTSVAVNDQFAFGGNYLTA